MFQVSFTKLNKWLRENILCGHTKISFCPYLINFVFLTLTFWTVFLLVDFQPTTLDICAVFIPCIQRAPVYNVPLCTTCPCIQRAPVYNVPLYTTCPFIQRAPVYNVPLYTTCSCIQRASVYNVPLYTTCPCIQRALVYNVPLYTTCPCIQRVPVYNVPLYTTCSCIQRVPLSNVPLYTTCPCMYNKPPSLRLFSRGHHDLVVVCPVAYLRVQPTGACPNHCAISIFIENVYCASSTRLLDTHH